MEAWSDIRKRCRHGVLPSEFEAWCRLEGIACPEMRQDAWQLIKAMDGHIDRKTIKDAKGGGSK